MLKMTNSKLKEHFDNDLKHRLRKLEGRRIRFLILLILPSFLIALLLLNLSSSPFQLIFLVLLLVLVTGFIVLSVYPQYRFKYRAEIVADIVRFINPDFKYYPGEGISYQVFMESGLYERKPQAVRSNDYTLASVANSRFEFCTVRAESHPFGLYMPLFVSNQSLSGLFMHMDLGYELNFRTYIMPARSSQFMGTWSQKNSLTGRGHLTPTRNEAFDKHFSVYTNGEAAIHDLLTPTMIKAILKLNANHKGQMMLSFLPSGVYYWLDYPTDIFNPRIFRSGMRFEDIEIIHRTFLHVLKVVSALKSASEAS